MQAPCLKGIAQTRNHKYYSLKQKSQQLHKHMSVKHVKINFRLTGPKLHLALEQELKLEQRQGQGMGLGMGLGLGLGLGLGFEPT